MKPIDTFRFVKQNFVHLDGVSLGQCYLPLIGSEGLALYTYLISFYDYGTQEHLLSDILNHLNVGIDRLEATLDKLTAMKLVSLSLAQDHIYTIVLKPALTNESFLNHHIFSHLLEKKIGEVAYNRLKITQKDDYQSLNKKATDVFQVVSDIEEKLVSISEDDFDLIHFKQMMARDSLRFANEKDDVLVLFQYAEKAKKSWFETYQMAKETAINSVISTKRLLNTLHQEIETTVSTSEAEQSLIKWAKSRTSLEFLSDIKQSRQASITSSERLVLKEIAQLGLLDPVINVLVLFTFNKIDSANLNEKYALKIGNELSYHKINSAEGAISFLKEPRIQEHKKQSTYAKSTKSNVPEWSMESYRTEATEEELEELEALRRRMLGDKEA
ncbi:DNA helicase [Streptococcus moroccensis]|uniref:Replication initiation and membrane attachment protein n=1 Tax=Streptococcus moroccensis TaxID=1451356 RepID=A0ABT9YQF2_9STRE|nr:DNA helicase [Streptococcus moroccensis]MDQ0222220.1 replication initiation and membrane attachment protein [Streptococcus moroccensis]